MERKLVKRTGKGLKKMTLDAMQADQNKAVKPIKKKPKSVKVEIIELMPVAVEKVKVGMVISGHGKVELTDPDFIGRRMKGKKWVSDDKAPRGFLFKTEDHQDGYFVQLGSTVWCVK